MAEFKGWDEDAQRFFIGLGLDNSKSYFEANRKVYEQKVKAPMAALLADLAAEFGASKIFRINRDIRFSKDKSPYKTNIAATIGDEINGGYISLHAKGLGVGGGRYHEAAGPELARFREAVLDTRQGGELVRIVERLESDGYEIGGEALKKVPPGHPADHPRARFLRHKSLWTWRDFGLQPWLGTPEVVEKVAQAMRDVRPMTAWLTKYVPADPGRRP